MKNTISFLGWIGVILTIISLILTLLTTYQFVYIKYFNGYYVFQLCIIVTMILWSINMLFYRNNFKTIVYPVTCVLIACAAIFFVYMRVY
ncbi:hypothetical protein KM800_11345 [Clostridium tyrobutyricum]|uniref:hypothetical protein n=1 Tax=Clostridium tyrobutyricum TaxID=1519 RepID=UPI001C392308|nr:hypothetical protein [Clostridium tyrobutyricum]MBV4419908.1 hypothetical protein [Clostridium tyrobutyricum]